jgi:hypothetical protein
MMPAPPLVDRPEGVTTEWLTRVLRHAGALDPTSRVAAFEAQAIGTGQVGANVRFRLAYAGEPGPASVVCKFASADPDSAAAGIRTLTYETEVAFYRDVAGTVDVRRPHCYFAEVEAGTANVVLVLEDLDPAEQGDQLKGCGVEEAELVIDQAAKLHGPRWGDPALAELAWLAADRAASIWPILPSLWDGFLGRYEDRLAPVTLDEGRRLMGRLDAMNGVTVAVPTVIHGDFRLDNLLFDRSGPSVAVAVVDWQTARLGAGPQDVAYFLGNSFPDPSVRRAHEERLVKRYHDGLLAYGVEGYPYERCWDDYRRYSYSSLVMAVIASMIVGRTERGDDMFVAMADRSARMAADLDAATALTEG